jgi:hypothetical protein
MINLNSFSNITEDQYFYRVYIEIIQFNFFYRLIGNSLTVE